MTVTFVPWTETVVVVCEPSCGVDLTRKYVFLGGPFLKSGQFLEFVWPDSDEKSCFWQKIFVVNVRARAHVRINIVFYIVWTSSFFLFSCYHQKTPVIIRNHQKSGEIIFFNSHNIQYSDHFSTDSIIDNHENVHNWYKNHNEKFFGFT